MVRNALFRMYGIYSNQYPQPDHVANPKAIYTESADTVDAATQQLQYLGLDLAMIGAYCSCFWLSSKIVGHSDAGKSSLKPSPS